MTKDKSFKQAVRRYAASTGKSYTQALATMRNDEFEAKFAWTGTARLPAHLEATYGIKVEGIAMLEPHGEGVIGVDRSDGPAWVARVFTKPRPMERVEADVAVLRYLEAQGFPAERLAHPEPVSVHEGQAVLVTEFVEGQPLPADAQGPAAGARTGADMLGRLHALPVPTDMPEGGAHAALGSPEGRPSRELEACRHMLDLVPKEITARHRPVYDRLLTIIDHADGCDGLPEAIIHPNLWGGEIIETPAGERIVIDWTASGRGPRLAALAAQLSHRVHAPQDSWFDDEVLAAFIAGYTKHVRLERNELDRLGAAILVRPAYYTCWRYWSLGAGSPTPWDTPAHKARDITTGMAGHIPDEKIAQEIAAKIRALL